MVAFQYIILILLISTGISSGTIQNSTARGFELRRKIVTADTAEINRYTRLAIKEGSKKPQNLQQMKAYIDTAENLCRRENIEIPAFLHFARAGYFYYSNDFKNALYEANIAVKIAKNNMDNEVLIRTMNFMGRYNLRTGLIEESLNSFNNAIELARKAHLNKYIPVTYSGMASTYRQIGKTKEYRNALEMVIATAGKNRDSSYLEDGYVYLGTSYMETEINLNKADSLIKIALELSYKMNDTSRIALALANLGWNYYQQMKYDSAILLYNQSLSYSIPAKIYGNSANAFGNLGTIYRDLNKTDLALKYYAKSIDQAKMGNDIYSQSWVYNDMSEMYIRKKDTANAYKTFIKYKSFNDEVLKSSSMQGLSDAKIQYEADTRNKELELLSLRVKNQRLLIYGSSGLFVLTMAVLILLLSRARINNKRKISEMNQRIAEITHANLRQQMNPHFIFNTLNSIQYYMYRHDKLATNIYLTKFSNLMRKVLENSQHTSIPLQDELDALNLYLELEKIRFKDKFEYQINTDEEIDTIMYKVPTMLIQPYVENSITHGLMPAEVNGMIKINLKLNKNYISCIIEDNGIGREAAQAINKNNGKNHHSMGTRIVNSRLELVNALYGTNLKTVYTDLKNQNGEPEGTRVEIHIPIMS